MELAAQKLGIWGPDLGIWEPKAWDGINNTSKAKCSATESQEPALQRELAGAQLSPVLLNCEDRMLLMWLDETHVCQTTFSNAPIIANSRNFGVNLLKSQLCSLFALDLGQP